MAEWISVKEKFPCKSGRYLVCHYRGEDRITIVQIAAYDPRKNKQMWFGSDAFSVITGVTHWRNLPGPPRPELRKDGGV